MTTDPLDEETEETIFLRHLKEPYRKVLAVYKGQTPLQFSPEKGGITSVVAVPVSELRPLSLWVEDVFVKGWNDSSGRRRGGVTKVAQSLLRMLMLHLPDPQPNVLTKMLRPRSVKGQTIQMPTQAYGHLYFILNWVDGKPFEIFAYIGKNGSDHQATAEGVCRLASLAFRYGISAEEVADQLRGIQSSSPEWSNGERIKSLEDAISKAIRQGLEEGDPSL